MMSDLKKLHPYLYRRVWLKGILFSLLGLSSVFSPSIDHIFHTERNAAVGVSSLISGLIFLVIGVGILVCLYGNRTWYLKARWLLWGAFTYALFWAFILLFLLIDKHLSTLSIFILWSYLTYNLSLIVTDSAWGGAELVKEVRETQNGVA